MRILSRHPEGRRSAPYLNTAAHRRWEPTRFDGRNRGADSPPQLVPAPDGISPARGIAIAIGIGALGWAMLIAQLARV
jgi:hypothetical protein